MNVVSLILALGAGFSFLAGAIQALVAWRSADSQVQKRLRPFVIGCILLTIALIGASYYSVSLAQTTPVLSGHAPSSPSSTPSATITSSSSSSTPTSQPTSTPSPTLSGPKTLSVNKILKCDACSDPVLVTITKIVIEPLQNRMLWFLTFSNTSQRAVSPYFQTFSLEVGDQITDPTGPGEQTYNPTGTTIPIGASANNIYLRAGEQQQVTLTFSFVPYRDFPYTLVTELKDFEIPLDITFNPVLFSF